jgi:HAD superfamily hydrolase (TIGR01450 family)
VVVGAPRPVITQGSPQTWILDLDGVVWRGDQPLAGAAAAVGELRARGHRLLFLTNNSSATLADYTAKLAAHGITASAEDVVTSAQAAATLVEPGERVLVCGGPGVEEALRSRGVTTVREGPAEAVVVGWHRDFDFERLTAAFLAVTGGARLIGTNDDPTYPTPEGLVPGGGAILAAVATSTGVAPTVAGKPHEPMAGLVRARLDGDASDALMVGDRPSTDGLMARRLRIPFALVLTGVTTAGDLPVVPSPDLVAADLATLVDQRGS